MKTILYIPSQQNKVYFVLIIKWKKNDNPTRCTLLINLKSDKVGIYGWLSNFNTYWYF